MHQRPSMESTIRPSDAKAPFIAPDAPGSGIKEGLAEQIERSRNAAREAGRLMIKDPVEGDVINVAQNEAGASA